MREREEQKIHTICVWRLDVHTFSSHPCLNKTPLMTCLFEMWRLFENLPLFAKECHGSEKTWPLFL